MGGSLIGTAKGGAGGRQRWHTSQDYTESVNGADGGSGSGSVQTTDPIAAGAKWVERKQRKSSGTGGAEQRQNLRKVLARNTPPLAALAAGVRLQVYGRFRNCWGGRRKCGGKGHIEH